jgi:inosine-uridine nucleoside N-ribohydrolase
VKIHLDTDVSGDIDDLQALAYVLASPDVELTGITTAAEDGGRRAGYVRRALQLTHRLDVPVAAGIDVASGRFRQVPTYPAEVESWGDTVPPLPGPAEAALCMLLRSLTAGATVVGIGPFTNIAALEELEPGGLGDASIVLMGTTVVAPAADLPQWGPEMDYNVHQNISAAATVLSCSSPLLVPVGVSMRAAIRRSHLPRLSSGGPLAALIARQAEAFDAEWHNSERYCEASGVPADMMNFCSILWHARSRPGGARVWRSRRCRSCRMCVRAASFSVLRPAANDCRWSSVWMGSPWRKNGSGA